MKIGIKHAHIEGKHSYLLSINDYHETTKDLLIGQPGKAHQGTSTLNRLNDLGRSIACKSKAGGV